MLYTYYQIEAQPWDQVREINKPALQSRVLRYVKSENMQTFGCGWAWPRSEIEIQINTLLQMPISRWK